MSPSCASVQSPVAWPPKDELLYWKVAPLFETSLYLVGGTGYVLEWEEACGCGGCMRLLCRLRKERTVYQCVYSCAPLTRGDYGFSLVVGARVLRLELVGVGGACVADRILAAREPERLRCCSVSGFSSQESSGGNRPAGLMQ
eukprot:6141590-Pleurochrysis_carterae.AAC.1